MGPHEVEYFLIEFPIEPKSTLIFSTWGKNKNNCRENQKSSARIFKVMKKYYMRRDLITINIYITP